MKIAILQSNYIPWKGYFDLINMVDEFIIYDDMQYTRRDWRNRNKIKTSQGLKWLTIPVVVKRRYHQKINETKISDPSWSKTHWQQIKRNYSKTIYFEEFREVIEELYLSCEEDYISRINYKFIKTICDILKIDTKIRLSSEFTLADGKTERLLQICKDCNADTYLSGPAAKDYFDENLAKEENIKVEWLDYSGYEEHRQLYPPFSHYVSILDLLFNEGPNSKNYMKSFK